MFDFFEDFEVLHLSVKNFFHDVEAAVMPAPHQPNRLLRVVIFQHFQPNILLEESVSMEQRLCTRQLRVVDARRYLHQVLTVFFVHLFIADFCLQEARLVSQKVLFKHQHIFFRFTERNLEEV